ncbi:DUF4097 family beta strand repeat-containing protein [Streptomyces halobius]|uniref:DUF4097 domain-containing protein n=1 Tax=Streptomyces halobius TaxID=2879846 RepID=A0ABY4MEH9_9ACTN|nr:DUF4097 family beta strand repeat-containing protein [Streptomyces halobius]UQA94810.1 DUF4097 domain-containing protein [Streptomyces halobius]
MKTKQHSLRTAGGAQQAALCAVAATALLTSACSATPIKRGEQSYEVKEKATSLRVDDHAGAIEVIPGTGDVIKVTEKYEYSDDQPPTEHSVKGGELLLKNPGCGAGADKCVVKYRVEVPAATATHLTLGGGEITVRGLSGATYAKSDGGSVRITDSTARTVTARVGGGDVTVALTAAPDKVEADTGGGNTTVRLPKGSYDVNAETGGGNRKVSVQNDSASPHKIKASSGGGNVSVLPAD